MFSQNSGEVPSAAANLMAMGAVNPPWSLTSRLTEFRCTPMASASSLISMPLGSRNSSTSILPVVTGLRFVVLMVELSYPRYVRGSKYVSRAVPSVHRKMSRYFLLTRMAHRPA